jgi:CMP-N-acetylneuraminic acid synthetase
MAVQPRIVALVPMKGHSERVPNKNFRTFNGKPLYRWILDALLGLDEVAEVVINTDARAIFESQGVGGLPRVRLRDRKPELCGDFVSMNKVLADDVANVPADIYLMTHSTNPLLLPGTLRKAIGHYRAAVAAGTADSLFAVNRFQTRFYDGSGRPINHDPANLIRTQDLEPWYEENSNLYIFSAESFAQSGARIGARPEMFVTPRAESLDIDDEEGWRMAEAVAIGRERLA